MKWVIGIVSAISLAAISLSVPASVFSTKAYASKMDGKPWGAHGKKSDPACYNHGCDKKKPKR
jgi:hypothetical protein